MNNFAIACMSGTLKGVFIQGVLSAFEEAGLKADMQVLHHQPYQLLMLLLVN